METFDSELSDDTLVSRVSAKDTSALELLYRRHSSTIFGLAMKILRDVSAAEEVVQDVFTRLWRTPEKFDPNRGSLRSYLCTQAHSRSVDQVRSDTARRRRDHYDSSRESRIAVDLETTVTNLLIGEQVRTALSTLASRERDVIELAYFQGLTYVEVAQFLDEPEGTIKSRIRSGLKNLHSKLATMSTQEQEYQ